MVALERRQNLGRVKRPDGCEAQVPLGRLAMRGQQFVGLVAEFHDAARDFKQRGAGFVSSTRLDLRIRSSTP